MLSVWAQLGVGVAIGAAHSSVFRGQDSGGLALMRRVALVVSSCRGPPYVGPLRRDPAR